MIKVMAVTVGFLLVLTWALAGVVAWMPVCWYKVPVIISVVIIGAALMWITIENID
jgi:hypothetical protein